MLLKASIRALLILALALPAAAFGLSLGDIHLHSPLNSPLNAEIDIVDASPEELNSLQAKIPSADIFQRYGLDFPSYLSDVKVQLVRKPDGHEVLALTSSNAISEPVITLLVQLSWARGQSIREYTMLLDPPVYTPGQSTVAVAPVTAPTAGSETHEGSIARTTPAPAANPPVAAVRPAAAAPTRSTPPPVITPPTPATAAAPPPPPPVARTPAPRPATAPASIPPPEVTAPPAPTESQAAENSAASPGAAPGPAAPAEYTVRAGDTLSGIAARMAKGRFRSPLTQEWMIAIYQANPEAFDHNMNVLHAGAVLRMPEQTAVETISPADAASEIQREYAAWRMTHAMPVSSSFAMRSRPPERARLKLVTPAQPGGTDQGTQSASANTGAGGDEVQGSGSRRLIRMHDAALASMQARLASQQGTAAPADTSASPQASSPAAEPVEAVPASAPPLQPPPAPTLDPRSTAASIVNTLKDMWWIGAVVVMALLGVLALRSWRSRQQPAFDELGRLAMSGAGAGFASEEGLGLDGFDEVENPPPRSYSAPPPPRASARVEEVHATDTQSLIEQGDPLAEADFHMAYGLYDQAADLVRVAISREPDRRDLKVKLLEVYFVWSNKEAFLSTAHELAQTRDEAGPGEWERVMIMGQQIAPEDPLFAEGGVVSGAAAGGVDLDLEGGEGQVDYDVFGEEGQEEAVELEMATHETEFDYDGPTDGATLTRQMTSSEPESGDLALDDLGLELDGLQEQQDPESTMVAGMDERSRRVMEAAQQRSAVQEEEPASAWDLEALSPRSGAPEADTERLPAMGAEDEHEHEHESESDLALELEESPLRHDELDASYGYDEHSSDASYTTTQPMEAREMPDVEPATMSEVGTKLDLARAYMDMGDPDGARNILEEVLSEGSLSQRQEAQRLMESLPG